MTKLKCTEQQVLDAIKASRGIKTAIARKLGVSRWTVDEYLKRWQSCAQAYEDECETLLDQAEGKLYEKAIVEGSECSLHFLLATKGKGRGYVRASKHEHSGGDKPVEVKTTGTVTVDHTASGHLKTWQSMYEAGLLPSPPPDTAPDDE